MKNGDKFEGARILIIDDEAQIRKFLSIALKAEGYSVECAGLAEEGLSILSAKGADLVVLDMGLPDLDGIDVIKEIRSWSEVPVLVLSVRSGDSDKVFMLDAGADDYVTKPFSLSELLARIRVILRNRASSGQFSAPGALAYRDLEIDPKTHVFKKGGEEISLTKKEFSLMYLLMEKPGQVVLQKDLLRHLWGPTHTEDTHYLRILAAKLRAKLGDPAEAPNYLVTELGIGLKLK